MSLRSPATRDALTPQDGLYTLALRDAGDDGQPTEQLRMVGSVLRIMVAEEDPNAVLERIAYPQTRIVSLTITEKGYSHEPSTGYLRWDDPDILHDLEHPERPRSAIGILTYGLALRRERRLPPLTLLSCDNLHANGDTLCNLVLAFALRLDVTLAAWIDKNCTFPNSMVDRIVPGTLDEDRARISARLGFEDAWPVVGEPYLNWVIEDKFAAGRPAWDLPGGATFVRNAAPYERLKLRMVNAPHSGLAYLGAMLGMRTASEAAQDPALRRYAEDLMRLEIAPTLRGIPESGLEEYRRRFMARVSNPALSQRLQQIAMDGSRKCRSVCWARSATGCGAAMTAPGWCWPWRPGCTICAATMSVATLTWCRIRWPTRWPGCCPAPMWPRPPPRRRSRAAAPWCWPASSRCSATWAGSRPSCRRWRCSWSGCGSWASGSIGGTGAGTGLMCRGSPACAQGSPAMKRRLALYVERRDSTQALACVGGRQATIWRTRFSGPS